MNDRPRDAEGEAVERTSPPVASEEYLRRNLNVCAAYGALAAANKAAGLERECKRPRKWMLRKMHDITSRLDRVIPDLVAYRDQVKP